MGCMYFNDSYLASQSAAVGPSYSNQLVNRSNTTVLLIGWPIPQRKHKTLNSQQKYIFVMMFDKNESSGNKITHTKKIQIRRQQSII